MTVHCYHVYTIPPEERANQYVLVRCSIETACKLNIKVIDFDYSFHRNLSKVFAERKGRPRFGRDQPAHGGFGRQGRRDPPEDDDEVGRTADGAVGERDVPAQIARLNL